MEKPGLWKLAPAAVLKPWGLLHGSALRFSGVRVGVGELWLASAQTGAGNYSNAVLDPPLRRTLAELLEEAASEGPSALEALIGAAAARHLEESPHRGKSEAWHIRAVEGRTGIVAGPRTREDAERLAHLIRTEGLRPDVSSWPADVRHLFGVVEPLQGGEVFLVPAGTLHTMFAVGPQSCLIVDEIQQGYGESKLPTLSKILMVQDDILSVQVHPGDATVAAAARGETKVDQDLQANPTVRVYDFGRRPGEDAELGFRLVAPEVGLRRVEPLAVEVDGKQRVEILVACRQFAKSRLHLRGAGEFALAPLHGSYRILHCSCGAAELRAGNRTMQVERGETAFVPACLEAELRIETRDDCAFFDDAFPDVAALSAFLGRRGARADRIEALLQPPRAL